MYNIGGVEYRSVREMSDIVIEHIGLDDKLVEYLPEDKHNIKNKRPNIDKAISAFGHNPSIELEEGIPKTIEWMKSVYSDTIGNDSHLHIKNKNAI